MDLQLSTPADLVPETEITLAGLTLYQVITEHFADLMADHQINLYTYKNCCSGKKLVDWVLNQSIAARTRQQVVVMWQALLTEGIIQHVLNEHQFRDDAHVYYRFVDREIPENLRVLIGPGSPSSKGPDGKTREKTQSRDCESLLDSPIMSRSNTQYSVSSSATEGSPTSSPRSSITSLLEECFELITQLGPEALIFSTLMKPPSERTEDDLQIIYEELLHVKAFSHMSNAIKQELAAIVHFENHPVPGKFLFREGDPGTSWYIILRGSVNVLIGNKGVVCMLNEGDEFGKLAVINKSPRNASIQLREPNCCFLRIDRDDFSRILLSVEKNTVKLKEHGKEVLLLEKSVNGRYYVVKGKPLKMLEYLLTLEIGQGGIDESFAQDFFLTYPAFMTVSEMCENLMNCYESDAPPFQSPLPQTTASSSATEEDLKKRKKSVVTALTVWVDMAKAEIIKDPTFQQLLNKIQDALTRDSFEDELKELNLCLMGSIRRSSISDNIKTSSPATSNPLSLPFQLKRSNSEIKIELGICAIPPSHPTDAVNIRVHTLDKRCCRLHIKLGTTAEEILQESGPKLGFDPALYELCEAKSNGEKVMFKRTDLSISTEMSVNGRLYAIPQDHLEKTIPPLPDQNQKPTAQFPENESSKDIACHLTMYDWNLFSNIVQMEFIYQVFGRHRFSKIVSNLDLLIRRFNEIQFWVVSEVCNESNLQKRVKVLVKFIKIASHCKSFNNLNSFFAIVIGLMNGAIARLKQTWEKVPSKMRRRYEQFEALMDPTRNHRVLRAYQSKLQPPVIPFIPLVTKDAFFLHEANETFVDGLVNFEKMQMVAAKVRDLAHYRKGVISNDLKATANKNPALQKYIRDLKVVDNQQMLMQMSHAIEPNQRIRTASAS